MKKVLTIPNILSIIRILMIPPIIYIYFSGLEYKYALTAVLVLLSGLTDVVDGYIARHFNMISNVGKVLDPIADKLTQFTVIICISVNHTELIPVAIIIFAKELLTLIGAVIFVRRGNETPYARWWGKMTTVILYATMTLFIISDIYPIHNSIMITASSVSIACLAFSFYNYLVVYLNGRKKAEPMQTEEK